MKLRVVTLTVVLIVLMAISAPAFDGRRKGFILGGGLGFGLTSYTFSPHYPGMDRENKGAFMSDFKIGYAPNDQLEIYYFSKVSWISADYTPENKATVSTGVGGLGTTYSLKTVLPTFYVAGGLGFSSWSFPFEDNPPDPMSGFGIFGGAGYEFSRHLNLEFDLMYGTPSKNDVTVKPISVKLTLNALAY
jgi:hypothetical protein